MSNYHSSQHHLVKAIEWNPVDSGIQINNDIFMSKGTSNGYLINCKGEDVIINTGAPNQGARYRQRYEQLLGRALNVKKIIITQHHFDHIGGWAAFADKDSETLVQRELPVLLKERDLLAPFFGPRGMNVIPSLIQPPHPDDMPLPAPQTVFKPNLFDDTTQFNVGHRAFELISVPSGETLDSIVVWLPEDKALFTGNWMGALYGALPNFYTLRGDRQRSIPRFINDIERMIRLRPALLITGHDDPIVGEERILAGLTKLRDAVKYIHDETVKGMNNQYSLNAIMDSIELPKALTMNAGRGPVGWYVRAVYEEYVGWFKHELTTELYATPTSSIWPELSQLLGGTTPLINAAKNQLTLGNSIKAMHFIEIALAAEPDNKAVLTTQINILEALLDRSKAENFDEAGWLETRIALAKKTLVKH